MSDGFWHKAWQFALLFGVIALMAASIVVQNGALSSADVREIVAEEDGGGGTAGAAAEWPVDQSIRPDLVPVAQLAAAPADERHVSIAPDVAPTIARADQRTWEVHIESIESRASALSIPPTTSRLRCGDSASQAKRRSSAGRRVRCSGAG